MRLKSGILVFSVAFHFLLTSCVVTKSEGERMSADIARLRSEIAALQREQSDSTIVSERRHSELQRRVDHLEGMTFKKATNESAESERLKQEVEQLRGQLEETQKNFETIRDKAIVEPSIDIEKDIPADKKAHFEWAKEAFAEKDFNLALMRVESFIEKYHDDAQYGVQALLLKGDAAVRLAKKAPTEAAKKDFYKKAVVAYQELLTRFPKSPKIPEALFKVGETLEAMGFAADAKIFYEEITLKHGKSTFAKEAKVKLAGLPKKKK